MSYDGDQNTVACPEEQQMITGERSNLTTPAQPFGFSFSSFISSFKGPRPQLGPIQHGMADSCQGMADQEHLPVHMASCNHIVPVL